MLSVKAKSPSNPNNDAAGAKRPTSFETTANRSRALDARIARHLMLVAMDARAEGDHRLAEHLLNTGYVAFEGG